MSEASPPRPAEEPPVSPPAATGAPPAGFGGVPPVVRLAPIAEPEAVPKVRTLSAGAVTRRVALGALGAGAAGFVAFGPRGASERPPSGRIVLDYWEKWTRHEGDAMQRVVDAFNESQSRIFVRYLVVSDIGQKSLVAVAGGRPPDVIGLYAFNVPPYAETGAVLALDALAPAHGVTLDRYQPGVRGVMEYGAAGGNWWACVNTAGSVALYYDKAAFREVGLDPERPPTTIEELDEAHGRLIRERSRSGGSAGDGLERVGFLQREPGWWSWLWGYHFGGKIYDRESDRSTIASAENVRAFAWMQSYARGLGVDRVKSFAEGFGNYFTPENPFLTGKVAMVVQGPWMANLINAFKPGMDYGVAPFPVVKELYDPKSPVGLIDTDVLVIPRGAKNPDASMEFIAFTQTRAMTELLAKAHCKPSPLKDVSEEFARTHPNRGIGVHYGLLASPRAFVPPRTRVWQQFKDECDSTVQRLWRLEATPEAALGELEKRTQGLIDTASEQRARRARKSGRAGGGA